MGAMTGRVAIFTDEPGWHGARLVEAFAARGVVARFASLAACSLVLRTGRATVRVPGFGDALPDGAFVRGISGGSLEQVVLRLDVLHALRALGVPVYNDGRAIERSVDKAMTSFLLAQAGVPVPDTLVTSGRPAGEGWLSAAHARDEAVVVKPLFGSQGEGLDRLEVGAALPSAEACHGVYYLQRFVDGGRRRGQDWRVFVIAGRAVAAARRQARGWVSNIAQGGRCLPAVPDGELAELAEQAATALGIRYAGVDIIRDARGRNMVLEVNGVPAWRGLQSVAPVDIARLLVEDFLAHVREPERSLEAAG